MEFPNNVPLKNVLINNRKVYIVANLEFEMKIARKHFFYTGLLGLAEIVVAPKKVIADEDVFVFIEHKNLDQYMLKGYSIRRVYGNNLYFVDTNKILKETEPYKQIKIGDAKRGTAKYDIAIAESSKEVIKLIYNYFTNSENVVVAKRILYDYDTIFELVPKKYMKKSLNEIVDSLDYTGKVIESNKQA